MEEKKIMTLIIESANIQSSCKTCGADLIWLPFGLLLLWNSRTAKKKHNNNNNQIDIDSHTIQLLLTLASWSFRMIMQEISRSFVNIENRPRISVRTQKQQYKTNSVQTIIGIKAIYRFHEIDFFNSVYVAHRQIWCLIIFFSVHSFWSILGKWKRFLFSFVIWHFCCKHKTVCFFLRRRHFQ